MSQKYTNNAYSTLASPLNIGGTTMFVSPGHGARWPEIVAPNFAYTTLEDALLNIEIVKITAHAAGSDQFTVVRAQQGTTERNWSIGDLAEMRTTAVELTAFEDDIDGLQATRALKAGETYTGTHDFTGATVTVAAPAAASHAVTKAYADALAFAAALPAQAGNAGNVPTTDGANASWTEVKTINGNSLLGAGNVSVGDVKADGSVPMTADLQLAAGVGMLFEGTTEDAFETRLVGGEPTADRVVTLPDATTTLVGADATQTLTNKTIGAGTTFESGALARLHAIALCF